MKRAKAERLLLKSGWLAERPPEVRAEILRRCQVLLAKPGSFLRLAGDDPGGIYGIASGAIGIQPPLATEEQTLVHVSRRGTWFGYALTMKNTRHGQCPISSWSPACFCIWPCRSCAKSRPPGPGCSRT